MVRPPLVVGARRRGPSLVGSKSPVDNHVVGCDGIVLVAGFGQLLVACIA